MDNTPSPEKRPAKGAERSSGPAHALSDLDDETAAAINRAEAQVDRGEGIDFAQFETDMRKRIARR